MSVRDHRSLAGSGRSYAQQILIEVSGNPEWQDHDLYVEISTLSVALTRLNSERDNVMKGNLSESFLASREERLQTKAAHIVELLRR